MIPDRHVVRPEFGDGPKPSHPFLIVSINDLTSSGVCIGIPGTGVEDGESRWHLKVAPDNVIAKSDDRHLSIDTHFLVEQMRVVATSRLKSRAGRLHGVPRVRLEEIIRTILCLE